MTLLVSTLRDGLCALRQQVHPRVSAAPSLATGSPPAALWLGVVLCVAVGSVGCTGAGASRHADGSTVAPTAAYDTVYSADAVDQKPEARVGLRDVGVSYPDAAKREGVGGVVRVRFVVSPEGRPTNLQVVRSAHFLLDREAVKIVARLRYTPGRDDGAPVPVRMEIPLTFRTRTPFR